MLKNFNEEEFDIIIQAGQSNSFGAGRGAVQNPYIPNDRVWYLNDNFTVSIACETVFGNEILGNYSLSFADKYINNNMLKGNRKLIILRTSVGGTGFLDHRWGMNDDLFLIMMEMIKISLELNENNRLIALLWHQGEADAVLNASYETHYANLSTLVNAVKTTFHRPDLPFIAGDFTAQWKKENKLICEPVIRAIKDVCRECINGVFVTTDELLSNSQTYCCGDTIHCYINWA